MANSSAALTARPHLQPCQLPSSARPDGSEAQQANSARLSPKYVSPRSAAQPHSSMTAPLPRGGATSSSLLGGALHPSVLPPQRSPFRRAAPRASEGHYGTKVHIAPLSPGSHVTSPGKGHTSVPIQHRPPIKCQDAHAQTSDVTSCANFRSRDQYETDCFGHTSFETTPLLGARLRPEEQLQGARPSPGTPCGRPTVGDCRSPPRRPMHAAHGSLSVGVAVQVGCGYPQDDSTRAGLGVHRLVPSPSSPLGSCRVGGVNFGTNNVRCPFPRPGPKRSASPVAETTSPHGANTPCSFPQQKSPAAWSLKTPASSLSPPRLIRSSRAEKSAPSASPPRSIRHVRADMPALSLSLSAPISEGLRLGFQSRTLEERSVLRRQPVRRLFGVAQTSHEGSDVFSEQLCNNSFSVNLKDSPRRGPSLKLVVFDFDCTLTIFHVFASLADPSPVSARPFLQVSPPHASTELGQLRRLADLETDPAWGPGAFALQAFGGADRVQRLRMALEALVDRGVECVICSRGLVGPIRKCLEQVNLLQFFTSVHANLGSTHGNTDYDDEVASTSHVNSEKQYLGCTDTLAAGVADKAETIARCLKERGLLFSQVVYFDDDIQEVASVTTVCRSVHIPHDTDRVTDTFFFDKLHNLIINHTSHYQSAGMAPTSSNLSTRTSSPAKQIERCPLDSPNIPVASSPAADVPSSGVSSAESFPRDEHPVSAELLDDFHIECASKVQLVNLKEELEVDSCKAGADRDTSIAQVLPEVVEILTLEAQGPLRLIE